MQPSQMSNAGTFFSRLYVVVVSTVTLFMLMFSAIDLLSLGLKSAVFTSANVPEYLENCSAISTQPSPAVVPDSMVPMPGKETLQAECEERNKTTIDNYHRQNASNAVRNISMILISLPLFLIHFRILLREWKEDHKK